jgi:hypothetical protein
VDAARAADPVVANAAFRLVWHYVDAFQHQMIGGCDEQGISGTANRIHHAGPRTVVARQGRLELLSYRSFPYEREDVVNQLMLVAP